MKYVVIQWIEEFYSYVINGTLSATSLLIVYFCFRRIVQNRLSKRVQYVIWLIILLRILLPKIPESKWSIFNYLPTYNQASIAYYMKDLQSSEEVHSDIIVSQKDTINFTPLKSSITRTITPVFSSMIYHLFLPVWAIGALGSLIAMLAAYIRFYLNCKRLYASDKMNLTQLLANCKSELHIKQKISLFSSDKITSPAAIGIISPKIILPEKLLSSLNNSEIRFIFLHELAHIKRKDILINWITCLATSFHWFNPFIIHAFKRMREDREICCDMLALSCLNSEDVKLYGHTLVKTLETSQNPMFYSVVASFSSEFTFLRSRILAVKNFKVTAYKFTLASFVALTLLCCTLLTNAQTLAPSYMGIPQSKDKFLQDSVEIYVLLKTRYDEQRQFTEKDLKQLRDYYKYNYQSSVIQKYKNATEFLDVESAAEYSIIDYVFATKRADNISESWKMAVDGYLKNLKVLLQQMMV